MGWPDKNQNAEYVCQRYNRRLCSSKDLEILAYTQKRGFCLLAWAFDIRFKKVRGFLTNTEKMPCFSTTGGTYELPPYGPFPQVFSYTKNVLYYICVIKQSEREREYECSGNGSDYNGYQSKTETGETCQWWEVQYPNKHIETPDNNENPEFKSLQKNYCRNPDNSVRPVI
ncbi:threonyl-tRNA synthetase [Bonamia ostreae]|uniref:Threonyl-tRNA synthetase n=1 Tax=Bonamia ostreae TaxID=126728 RepID=A0ABV2AJ33_9EUKA